MAELFAEQAAVPGEQHGRGRRADHVVVAGGEARLTSRDRALAVAALGATSRWLALIAGWLAEQGAEPVAVGLVEAARQDVAEVCNKLSPTTSGHRGDVARITGRSAPCQHPATPLAGGAPPQSG